MKSPRKKIEERLDKIWRTQTGKECEICKTLNTPVKYTQLHPHHLIPRGHKATRWEPLNRIWLCPTHHTMGADSAHQSPIWFSEWLKKNKPKTYKWTLEHMNLTKHFTLSELENLVTTNKSCVE